VRLDHLLSKEHPAALVTRVARSQARSQAWSLPESITGYSVGSLTGPLSTAPHGEGNGGAGNDPAAHTVEL
jgi:hypothetical protein